MKKLLIFLAALMLLATSALAEVKVESTTALDTYISLADATNCYTAGDYRNGYYVADAQGNELSGRYGDLYIRQYGMYYEYRSSGLNYKGLLGADGRELTGPDYNDIDYYGDNWALGIVLEVATGEDFDYRDNKDENVHYLLTRADLLYQGKVIGSLSRQEYKPNYSYVGDTGDYFYVKQTDGSGFYVDKNFTIVHVSKDFTTSEFTEVYKKGVFHNPTQQWAFTAGCTLTPDQVSCPVRYIDQTDSLVDLQGNVVKDNLFFDSVRYAGDYILVRRNSLYGIMDLQGNVIVEPKYKEIAYSYGLFEGDYQTALTPEGYLHFIDKQGNVTAKAEYELTSSDYKGYSYSASFVVVKNMGKCMVITATAGELPTKYEDYRTAEAGHKVISVQKDGLWGAIDLDGNTVIPFVHKSSLELTADSSLAFGYDTENKKFLYHLAVTEPAAPAAPEGWTETKQSDDGSAPVLADGAWECACGAINTGKFCGFCGGKQPEATPTPAPAADGAWTCDCGSSNTGKFCPVCGAKKPEETPAPAADDGSWDCSCGSRNTGKFCPECGSKKPEAPVEPQCSGCGYKPEGAAPKFCPECGTKF